MAELRRPEAAPDAVLERARYSRILRFAMHHLAVTWWYEILLPRIGLAAVAERTRSRRMLRIAKRFHVLAVDLGGLMIKVGQFMSSRLDVLPPEITTELEGLQDEVPPVAFPAIRALAEAQLGAPLSDVFASFDERPVAAASLGQAHRAVLAPVDAQETGLERVMVKVQRPGIDAIIATDLAALRRVGGWLSRIRIVSSRVDMPELVEDFAVTSLEEIDYLHEAAGSVRFGTDFADDDRVDVPAVAWELSTRKVLTLEDVTAIKITDTVGLAAAGIDPAEVAKVFAAVMFDQLFVHGFFHADPHPGNIFVTPGGGTAERPWRLTFIDFGMMGEIPPSTRAGLRKLLIATASRDGRGLVAAVRDVGILLPSADTTELERAMTALFARFGGMGVAELREVDQREFREFGREFGETVRTLPVQLPEHFLLVIRAVSLISGVCTALDPQFNIWDAVEPYAQKLIRDERGNIVQDLAQQALSSARLALRLPGRLDELATRLDSGTVTANDPVLERRVARLERATRRTVSAVLFAALLIAGAVLRPDTPVIGTVLMVVAVLPLLHALLSGRGRR